MPTDDTLAAEFTRVARGDLVAFEGVYDVIFPRVLNVAYAVLRDDALAEEVAQEVMVEMWRTAPAFNSSRSTLPCWSAMLAYRRAHDKARGLSSQAARKGDRQWATERGTTPTGPDARGIDAEQDDARVRFALASLTARQRDCILLAHYGGYTYRQVAEHLRLPQDTVKAHIRSGLVLMHAVLIDTVQGAASNPQMVATA